MKRLLTLTIVALFSLCLALPALAETAMPQGFSGVVSAYPGGQVTKAVDQPPYAEVVTADAPQKMYEFYKADLQKNGWKITGDYPNMGGTWQLQATKDGQTATLGIGVMNDGKAIARIMLQ